MTELECLVEIIIEYKKQKYLDWKKLSSSKEISLQFIENNINEPWVWGIESNIYGILTNPNITEEFISKYNRIYSRIDKRILKK